MNAPCIVVANEPRAYREVLDHVPALVVCSALSAVVEVHPRAWIVLYPDGEDRALLSVAGVRRAIAGVELDDLLATIDESLRSN